MDTTTQNLDCNETINQFGVELTSFWNGNECERTHTLTTTTKGSKNSQKEANNNTSNQKSVLCPPKVPSLESIGLG